MSYVQFKDLGDSAKPKEGFNNLGIGSSKSERPRQQQVEKYGRDSSDTGIFPGGPPPNSPYQPQQPQQQPLPRGGQKMIPSGGPPISGNKSSKFAVAIENIDHKIDIINSHKIAVLDIWAPWCQPCLMIADKYEELAKKYNKRGVCVLGKENLEDKIQQPEGVNIKGIPTFLFFEDGVHIDTCVGADLGEVETKLQEMLSRI
jgi:thioredoxin 1